MSLAKASVWTAGSTLIKIGAGLLVIKLMALTFGPAGIGQALNFRQLITVLGVLSGAGIFNGVTKYIAEHRDDAEKRRGGIRYVLNSDSGVFDTAGDCVSAVQQTNQHGAV